MENASKHQATTQKRLSADKATDLVRRYYAQTLRKRTFPCNKTTQLSKTSVAFQQDSSPSKVLNNVVSKSKLLPRNAIVKNRKEQTKSNKCTHDARRLSNFGKLQAQNQKSRLIGSKLDSSSRQHQMVLTNMRRNLQASGTHGMTVDPSAAVFVNSMMQTVLTTFLDTTVARARNQLNVQSKQRADSKKVNYAQKVMINPSHIQDAVQYSSSFRNLVLGNAGQQPTLGDEDIYAKKTNNQQSIEVRDSLDTGRNRKGNIEDHAIHEQNDSVSIIANKPEIGHAKSLEMSRKTNASSQLDIQNMQATYSTNIHSTKDTKTGNCDGKIIERRETPASFSASLKTSMQSHENQKCSTRQGTLLSLKGQTIILDNGSSNLISGFPRYLSCEDYDEGTQQINVEKRNCTIDATMSALTTIEPRQFAYATYFEATARSLTLLLSNVNLPVQDDMCVESKQTVSSNAIGKDPSVYTSQQPKSPNDDSNFKMTCTHSDPDSVTVLLGGCLTHFATAAVSHAHGHLTDQQLSALRNYCRRFWSQAVILTSHAALASTLNTTNFAQRMSGNMTQTSQKNLPNCDSRESTLAQKNGKPSETVATQAKVLPIEQTIPAKTTTKNAAFLSSQVPLVAFSALISMPRLYMLNISFIFFAHSTV